MNENQPEPVQSINEIEIVERVEKKGTEKCHPKQSGYKIEAKMRRTEPKKTTASKHGASKHSSAFSVHVTSDAHVSKAH